MLVNTNDELAKFCKKALSSRSIAVDTEFILEKRYWPELCLVQLGLEDGDCVAIDTKANLDLEPLFEVLKSKKITKILHSSREDLLIFHRMMGEIPNPVFDTQLAAMFAGYGAQPGYATIVKKVLGKQIDKSQQLTDWAKRPLNPEQIDYALNDVRYLPTLQSILERKLKNLKRIEWLRNELQVYERRYLMDANPYEKWRKLHLRQPTKKRCAVLREVVAWRELYARKHDMPVRWVIGDFPMIEMAQNPPKNFDQFKELRFLPKDLTYTQKGRELFNAIRKGLNTKEADMPEIPEEGRAPTERQESLGLLNLLLTKVCTEKHIAASLVANQNDLRFLISGGIKYNKVMLGWRKEVFGELALKLLNGSIGLKIENKKVTILEDTKNSSKLPFLRRLKLSSSR